MPGRIDVDVAPDGAEPAPLLLTTASVCRVLQVGKTTVFALIKTGELDTVAVGPRAGSTRVTTASVRAYVERRTAAGAGRTPRPTPRRPRPERAQPALPAQPAQPVR